MVSLLAWEGAGSSFDFRIVPTANQGVRAVSRPLEEPFTLERAPQALVEHASDELWLGTLESLASAVSFERGHTLILLDASTNVDRFGVAWTSSSERVAQFGVENLTFEVDGADMRLVALPRGAVGSGRRPSRTRAEPRCHSGSTSTTAGCRP